MGWAGGVDLIVYIANALSRNSSGKIYVLLSDNGNTFSEIYNPTKKDTRISVSRKIKLNMGNFKHTHPDELTQQLLNNLDPDIKIIFYKNTPEGLYHTARSRKIKVLLPLMTSLGRNFPIPWIGYIWDFQHRYLPDYFSNEDRLHRDKVFDSTMRDAYSVLVNAKQVKIDIKKILSHEHDISKVTALPFSPSISEDSLNDSTGKTRLDYKIPEKYFMISNQFWEHKSHLIAIRALDELRKDPNLRNIHIVCTGKMEEPRNPTYIPSIIKEVKKRGLTKYIHFTGYIPKNDQLIIMRGAIAVLQPTLYEGGPGGGASYSAVALGIPVIASDIPINKELNKGEVAFFRAGSASSLARVMKKELFKQRKALTKRELLTNSRHNEEELFSSIMECIDTATDNYRHSQGG